MQRIILVVSGLLVWAGAGCIEDLNPSNEKREAALRKFGSAEELRRYLVDQAMARTNLWRGGWDGILFFQPRATMAETTGGAATDANMSAGGGSGGFSGTNLQEVGVDESDRVKSGDGHFYLLRSNRVRIVRALPADDLTEVASVPLPDTPDSLYLYGGKLIALSQSYGWYDEIAVFRGAADMAASAPSEGNANQTTVTIIDVANPADPKVEHTLKFDGLLASSRMIGSRLHLVMTTIPPLPSNPTRAALAARPLEEWLPDYKTISEDGSTGGGDVVDWSDFYYPVNPDGFSLTLVITLDVNDPAQPAASTAVVADAGTVYASPNALYVTDTSYDVNGSWREDTGVHKFDLTESGAAYVGSGLVPGHLLNQYSLGEHDGFLRMAVTVQDFGGFASETGQSTNAVYVLGEKADGSGLEVVGSLVGLAPGERIYAARFVGKRGFLVTFRQIDPLFTIDLDDPRNPKERGRLKVEGYSDYIHIMDDDHLLTIGKDAVVQGDTAWQQGVQLSIFDISDFDNPVRTHHELIGARGTESEANWNPKAFTYDPDKQVLAIPINLYVGPTQTPWDYGKYAFSGLYVYRATPTEGFTLLGRIDTGQGSPLYAWGPWYSQAYTRGIFAEESDVVYAVTDRVVVSAPLAMPSAPLDELEFTD